ncbi:MAG: methyl-accepting chemotaxis protein [Phycisphaerae bacterium]|nr:methyl-accepting chemotaxis protein [Phycisphaerae bacterium]
MTVDAACPLFAYPPQAAFEKVLPKNKIYAHAKPTRRLQQRFTDEVAQIVWKYKLAPETIRIPAKAGVEEIQVFGVTLKAAAEDEFTEDVLRCIDKAIGFPILFEVGAADRVRAVAAFKRPSEADSTKWVVGDYFMSAWFPADTPRSPLPVALDLASLYGQLLRRLMPYPPRESESLKDHAERLDRIRSLQREHAKLETRLSREKQFNRKVEINAEARALQTQIDELTA